MYNKLSSYYIYTIILTISLFLAACNTLEQGETVEDSNKPYITEQKNSEHVTLFVSAAASLTDVLSQIKERFEENYPIDVTYNFGGSGTLAIQIERGAPVDLFISANKTEIASLVDHGLLAKESEVNVAYNELVLIKAKENNIPITSIEQLSSELIKQIAIGNPDTVPAGYYTKQALQKLNKWDELKGKFVFTQDVRQVLTYVETGNVDIGFVYKTDAIQSDKTDIILHIDENLHDTITYPAAITTYSKHAEAAEQFLQYLLSNEAQSVFASYGFNGK